MKIYLRYLMFIFAALLFGEPVVAGAASTSSKETLIMTGTGASIGVMKLMAEDFQNKHPRIAVEVLPSIGTSRGMRIRVG